MKPTQREGPFYINSCSIELPCEVCKPNAEDHN